ncbi:glycerate kinase [Hydrogenophaga sp. 5NK40-0174]|uniref:glycerate kinase type-2 family protein n=1 Tax=Hydrogenophaga sp. 5NK40-0174 TaxID=3127649 RepID=UPI00310BA1B8
MPLFEQDPCKMLRLLFEAAVSRAQPERVLPAHLPSPPKGRTVVIGAGKAAGAMAHAFEAAWPDHAPLSGLVITRYGHVPPRESNLPARIEVVEAAHPVPDEAGWDASKRILESVSGLGEDDLVVCLMSGGASALMTMPCQGLSLKDKQTLNAELLRSGANILEMNTVRKHLSAIKGGRLAAACAPARVLTLAISDVPGDDVSVIGSGPTVPDSSTCEEVLAILDRYAIDVPPSLRARLVDGDLETPKPGDACFAGHEHRVIAAPIQSLEAAHALALSHGLSAYILGDEIEGESQHVGAWHGMLARSAKRGNSSFSLPCVLLSGGETTVTLPKDGSGGRGGRAGEFCMGLVQELQGESGIWALAADTDGIDGVEDNAGAFVRPSVMGDASKAGVSLDDSLVRHDAHGFFGATGDLLVTGPTHTNVNDFRAILVLPSARQD